ncbi:probable ATP-dependent RNA helicase DDX43 [Leptidea sinapis]|uniref:RNA helicase n=1 Tax=Leptidea sinapis TaxID=189913 RepID=A0A5E4QQX0_9NEOP|nr:probable ATP-dependent RNA helicase DDX43 [Leptidea sinapis]VVC99741.1 unnamed protein product [Leptidea sinapis]
MDPNDEWDAYEASVAASEPPPNQSSSNSSKPVATTVYTNSNRSDWRANNISNTNRSNWRANNISNTNNQRFDTNNKKNITVPSDKVGRIIGKGGSKIRDLEYETDTKIQIGQASGSDTVITLLGSDDNISKVQEMIGKLTEEWKPPVKKSFDTATNSAKNSTNNPDPNFDPKEYMIINEHGEEVMDWERFNAYCDKVQKDIWANLPPIVKDFYQEDPEITAMTPSQVAQWRKVNNDIQVKRTFDDKPDLRPIPNPVLKFEHAFRNYPEILEQIYKQGFKQPSPIQSQAWPILLRGEDMIGIAQTGTGKTLAFLLPALIHIDGQPTPREERAGPTVLILAPTRELALQIWQEVCKYEYRGIKSVCLYGGANRKDQINQVSKGVDIVIATPGRFNDLVLARHLHAINFSYIVLDEADRMLDMGFEPQIRSSLFDVRPNRQCVMTSATWPEGVCSLAEKYMSNPIQVNVGSLDLAAVHTVTQKFKFVEEEDKDSTLFEFIYDMDENDKIIIFCGKKATASHISSELAVKGIPCQSIHGNLDQSDREAALADMLDGTVNILVATDVASRGIDIKDLTHVINLDFPRHIEEYVHRIGRTGRAGKTGTALTLITRNDWAHAAELIKILEEAEQDIPDELERMAHRFKEMKIRSEREGGNMGRGGRGRGGRGRGRGNRW